MGRDVMTTSVVGVHGVGNYRAGLTVQAAARALSSTWEDALSQGMIARHVPVKVRMAYYAAHLKLPDAQGADTDLRWLAPDEQRLLVAWAAQLGAMPADAPQAAWAIPARMVVDRIAAQRHLSAFLLQPFVAMFLREVGAYLRDPDSPRRRRVRATVAETIRQYQPHVVIAHSLGSVVCYESLWAYPDVTVDLLITIGSPLGLGSVVFDRLQPAPVDGRGLRPPNVRHWVNISDSGDIVAVPRPFTRRFGPDENCEDAHIHPVDFHSADRYLRCLPLIDAVCRYRASSG
jgi:hypothetical protein